LSLGNGVIRTEDGEVKTPLSRIEIKIRIIIIVVVADFLAKDLFTTILSGSKGRCWNTLIRLTNILRIGRWLIPTGTSRKLTIQSFRETQKFWWTTPCIIKG